MHGSTNLMSPISSALEAVGAGFDNPGGWETTLRFYAMMYGLPVLMANRVGTEGALTFWGGSCILDPFGEPLATAEDDAESLLTAELDYGDLRRARYLLPTVRDSNLAPIQREIERLSRIVGVPEAVRES
jgi:predicted amidohydrolase